MGLNALYSLPFTAEAGAKYPFKRQLHTTYVGARDHFLLVGAGGWEPHGRRCSHGLRWEGTGQTVGWCWVCHLLLLLFYLVLVYVFNFDLFEFWGAILEKGLCGTQHKVKINNGSDDE